MKLFGTTSAGEQVQAHVLQAGSLKVTVLTFGAVLQDVRLDAIAHSLTLGSPDLAAYEGPFISFGSLMGPVANRITDARARLDGQDLTFERNFLTDHTLHSGACGVHHKVWSVEDAQDDCLVLSVEMPAGEGGFPGNRRLVATYKVSEPAVLDLTLEAQTEAPTLMNTVNHSYWNLDGGPTIDGHRLQVHADRYLPGNKDLFPTGEIAEVDGTRFDFTQMRQITRDDVLDNNYCLSTVREPLRPVLKLVGQTGVTLEIETTEPGLQIYDGKSIAPEGARGHDGKVYGARAGLAIEPQFWPDATSHPAFPSIRLDPGEDWVQRSRFTFSTG